MKHISEIYKQWKELQSKTNGTVVLHVEGFYFLFGYIARKVNNQNDCLILKKTCGEDYVKIKDDKIALIRNAEVNDVVYYNEDGEIEKDYHNVVETVFQVVCVVAAMLLIYFVTR